LRHELLLAGTNAGHYRAISLRPAEPVRHCAAQDRLRASVGVLGGPPAFTVCYIFWALSDLGGSPPRNLSPLIVFDRFAMDEYLKVMASTWHDYFETVR
jgi:hypothetical protein